MDDTQTPREAADAEGVAVGLDLSHLEEYQFPSPTRRKAAAWFYVGGAAVGTLGVLSGLPRGLWAVVALFLIIAWLHARAAWSLEIDQTAALDLAATAVPFTVGHASAAVGFIGARSRPVWNVLLYSAVEPPDKRALVRFDATNGHPIGEAYVEDLEAL